MNKYENIEFSDKLEMLCWNLGNAVTALQLWKDTAANDFGDVGLNESKALVASENFQGLFLPSLEVIYECLRYVDAGIRGCVYEDELE